MEQSHLECSFKADIYREQRGKALQWSPSEARLGSWHSATQTKPLCSHTGCATSPTPLSTPAPLAKADSRLVPYWGGQLAQEGAFYLSLAARWHRSIDINLCYLPKADSRLWDKEPNPLSICLPELWIPDKANKPSRTPHNHLTPSAFRLPVCCVRWGQAVEVSFLGSIKKSSEKAQPFCPEPIPETERQITWLGYPKLSRKMQEGLACCTHSPVLSCHLIPKPSPFLCSQLLGQSDWMSNNTITLYFLQRFRMEVAQMLGIVVNWQSSVGKLVFTILSRKLQPCPCGKGGERSNINIGNVCPIRRTAVSSYSQLQDETLQVICCCCGCGGWKPGWDRTLGSFSKRWKGEMWKRSLLQM